MVTELENYASFNSRNIYEYFTPSHALFLCIDALDFKSKSSGEPDPRLKIRLCNYDESLPVKKRISSDLSVYLPLPRFLLLAHDVLNGVALSKKRASAAGQAKEKYPAYFVQYGGIYTEPVRSTKFILTNGLGTAQFAFLASVGPGVINKNGGISPVAPGGDKNSQVATAPLQSIFINMPDDTLKEFCLIGQAYANQYIALDLQTRLHEVRRNIDHYRAAKEELIREGRY